MQAWENAVKLAMNHVPERIPDVVTEVARRLIDIRRFAQAAELYEGIDAHREAINVYIAGGLWDQAKQLARSAAPQFAAEVEAAVRTFDLCTVPARATPATLRVLFAKPSLLGCPPPAFSS